MTFRGRGSYVHQTGPILASGVQISEIWKPSLPRCGCLDVCWSRLGLPRSDQVWAQRLRTIGSFMDPIRCPEKTAWCRKTSPNTPPTVTNTTAASDCHHLNTHTHTHRERERKRERERERDALWTYGCKKSSNKKDDRSTSTKQSSWPQGEVHRVRIYRASALEQLLAWLMSPFNAATRTRTPQMRYYHFWQQCTHFGTRQELSPN